MSLKERAKFVMNGESGASNLEIIVWMSVVLVIAGFLFAFRNKIAAFINSATGKVEEMQSVMDSAFDSGATGIPSIN